MKMPFPAMELSNRGWFKVFGVVTNRTLAGDEVIWWSRQRCGKGEEVHSVLKSDLAGGRLPSRLFGANAAWWAIAVLAFNLSSAMKRLVLGGQWVSRRLKAVRFAADSPSGTGDAARQEADHPAVAGPSLIRVVAQGSAEHIGAGCRALPSIGGPVQNIGRRRLSPVAQAAPCFLQPDNDHNWRLTVANPLRDAAQSPINTPVDTPHLL